MFAGRRNHRASRTLSRLLARSLVNGTASQLRFRVSPRVLLLKELILVLSALSNIPVSAAEMRGVNTPFVHIVDWSIWMLFVIEFLVMTAISIEPVAYVKRNWFLAPIIALSIPLMPAVIGLPWFGRFARLTRLLRLSHSFHPAPSAAPARAM